jgi:hypothetical protein
MTRTLKSLVVGVVVFASGLVWLAASAQTPAVPSWVSDPQVYAAAKKEGAVVHYCTLPQAYCEDIGKRFEKHTGIKATSRGCRPARSTAGLCRSIRRG